MFCHQLHADYLGDPKKLEFETETKVRKAILLAPCVIELDITKEHVQEGLNLHLCKLRP